MDKLFHILGPTTGGTPVFEPSIRSWDSEDVGIHGDKQLAASGLSNWLAVVHQVRRSGLTVEFIFILFHQTVVAKENTDTDTQRYTLYIQIYKQIRTYEYLVGGNQTA